MIRPQPLIIGFFNLYFMEDEIWMHVKGYKGFYMISSLGVVINSNGRIMKQSISSDGYYVLGLCKDGVRKKL